MIEFIKKNKLEAILVALIIIAALFFRLYRIDEYMTFLGDEGRDVRIVRDIISKGNLVFIGPQMSVGNTYLGPLYYYMMAPALFLANFNPAGPAIMIALLGVVTIFLTWYMGRVWFGKTAGILAALFYAISPIAIIYSKSSWNPNPMPFFALICMWGIYQVKNRHYFWLPIVAVSFAAALQMHYLGLLLFPTLFIYWVWSMKELNNDEKAKNLHQKYLLWSVAIFLILISPLVLFDLKHNFLNIKALGGLFGGTDTAFEASRWFLRPFSIISLLVNDMLLAGTSKQVLTNVIISFPIIYYLYQNRNNLVSRLFISWVGFTIAGLSLYKNPIYIHYLGLVFPAVFLLFGATLAHFLKEDKHRKYTILIIALLVSVNLKNSPIRAQPNNQLQRTEKAVDLIINESGGKPFNFGLIAKQNYDESYRYFLENKNSSLVKEEDEIADQLFVICEDGDKCEPEGHSQYQIAIFGIAKVDKEWSLDYLKIYRLVHYR